MARLQLQLEGEKAASVVQREDRARLRLAAEPSEARLRCISQLREASVFGDADARGR